MSDKESTTEVEEGAVKIVVDKDKYVPGRSGSGKRTLNNGDAIAQALNGMTLEEVETLAGKMKVEHNDYSHLNIGMQRMNIGNKIRGAVNKAEKAEAGTGFALLEAKSAPIQNKVQKRLAAAEKEAAAAAEKAAEKAATEAKAEAK